MASAKRSCVTASNLKDVVEAIVMNQNTYKPNPGRRLRLAAAGVTAVIVPIAVGVFRMPSVRAQQPTGALEFDAVSVKPSDPNSRHGMVVSVTPGGMLHVVNATLKDLIETAYDVRAFQIEGGPKWADATKYDVDATPGTRRRRPCSPRLPPAPARPRGQLTPRRRSQGRGCSP